MCPGSTPATNLDRRPLACRCASILMGAGRLGRCGLSIGYAIEFATMLDLAGEERGGVVSCDLPYVENC